MKRIFYCAKGGILIFICQKCGRAFELPSCVCGYAPENKAGIWQLSDAPDMVLEGQRDHYIGYEHIGAHYSGDKRYLIEAKDYEVAKAIASCTGNGVYVDLACGDGCLTVPAAALGIKIIAGDISNAMMRLLAERAQHNKISLKNVILCRMNALDIPIADNSVDCVTANSMLHLISNPEKVIHEIYRILKPEGVFICKDDAPGRAPDSASENARYLEIINVLYEQYWSCLKAQNITRKKYSWGFDRDEYCSKIFSRCETKYIEIGTQFDWQLKDAFLSRFMGRGFSDQAGVPQEAHDKAIGQAIDVAKIRFGENFDTASYHGVESDIALKCYIK